jgi:hypothetical protein
MLAAEGCIKGAVIWFERTLAKATEPTHGNILCFLPGHENPRLRKIAFSAAYVSRYGKWHPR